MKKLLCWSDAPVAFTGFGTVSRYVIGALQATGLFEIDQLAINYHGQFVNKEQIPWQLQPARLLDPKDPYGNKMFLRALAENNYDYVWILNDTFVVHQVAKEMRKIINDNVAKGKKRTIVIFYFPVDCRIIPDASDMLRECDVAISYNQHGKLEAIKALPELESKLLTVFHGTDTQRYKPFSKKVIDELKTKYFNVDPDTYLVINVNRNSIRKQISRSMLAFKEFQKVVPKSLLYLHTAAQDRDIDLVQAAQHIGLRPKKDLVFPPNYSAANGYPEHVLNELYNCGDQFLTTHLGEGWGLSVTEAMAAGVPVIAPRNTSMPEILGTKNERGWMYDMSDHIYVDNSGYRPMGSVRDIVDQMLIVHRLGWKHDNKKVIAARQWVEANNWSKVCGDWIGVFNELMTKSVAPTPEKTQDMTVVGELL